MRKSSITISMLIALVFLPLYGCMGTHRRHKPYSKLVREKTINYRGSDITVRVIPRAAVLKVKPYIKAKKGKKKGRLYLKVVIKNTGNKPQNYSIFGQGKTKSGGWLGGSLKKVPKKGKLDPGEKTTAKVKTRYKGKTIPREIRVEIFPAL
ncbi:MAG: hypothetical protein ACE5HC_06085 [Candidatus Binatia bacterium]